MIIVGPKKLRTLKRFSRTHGGNAGVEFAFILPLLMLLCFGAIELGRALHDYHVVNQTVRDAARHLGSSIVDCSAAVPGDCATCNPQDGTCTGGCSFINTSDVTAAKNIAMTGSVSDGASNLLAYWTPASLPGGLDIQICALDNSAANLGGIYTGDAVVPHVRVQANVDFTFLFGQLVSPDATIDFEIAHNTVLHNVCGSSVPDEDCP